MNSAGKRMIAGAIALILTAGLFTGCSNQKADSSAATESYQASIAESASELETFGETAVSETPVAEASMLEETYEPDPDAAAAMASSLLEDGSDSTENPMRFTDVDTEAYYYQPLVWALDNSIVSGTSDTTFSPDEICTRGQMVTFLYRVAGSPSVSPAEDPFTDISELPEETMSAVLWASSNGITSGTGDGTFEPDLTVTRLQVVTFLWRMAGSPEPTSQNSMFEDTNETAVIWAADEGITSVGDNGLFAPDDPCTRGQVVTFIYRYCMNEGVNPGAQSTEISAESEDGIVSLTIGAAYLGDVTQEQLTASAVEKGYQSATLNPDGSAVFTMTQTVYDQLIATLRSNIDESMAAMPGSEEYPTVTTVYANDNYSIFTIQTSAQTEEEAAEIPVDDLFLCSAVYAQYTQNEVPDVLVIVANEESGAILREVRSSDNT